MNAQVKEPKRPDPKDPAKASSDAPAPGKTDVPQKISVGFALMALVPILAHQESA